MLNKGSHNKLCMRSIFFFLLFTCKRTSSRCQFQKGERKQHRLSILLIVCKQKNKALVLPEKRKACKLLSCSRIRATEKTNPIDNVLNAQNIKSFSFAKPGPCHSLQNNQTIFPFPKVENFRSFVVFFYLFVKYRNRLFMFCIASINFIISFVLAKQERIETKNKHYV